MTKRMLFIYNPRAGKELIKDSLADVIDIFVKSQYEVVVHPTQGPRDAIETVANISENYDLICCCGGDGTLDEVVEGIMHLGRKIPIGYIPAGSTNDFGGSLNLSKDLRTAAETAVMGNDFCCDVGVLNDKYFTYVAAFGIFTDVTYDTPQDMKNTFGYLAYVLEGVKRLPNYRSYYLTIETDDDRYEDDFILGMITNSSSVGGIKGITGTDISLNDGLFEVTLIRRPSNALELNGIIAALLDHKRRSSYIISLHTRSIRFTSKDMIPWTTDGEFGGCYKETYVKNIKEAFSIRVPQIADESYLL